ncbi:MAG: glycosyltransferase family 39 protein, partial [Candidatus Altiarchaeota archaeon]|nr:glycosyltransferase family 39 protein [Candidatus Altiarchaeota archaeon]
LICKTYFKNTKTALIGPTILYLTPRIFAHSFFNLKDIPYMTAYTAGIYFLLRYLKDKSRKNTIYFAVATSFAINMRLPGAMLAATAFTVIGLDAVAKRKIPHQDIKNLPTYLTTTLILVILLWPYLWEDTLTKLIEITKTSANYNYGYPVVFLGEYIKPYNLPGYYIPLWILITTPPLYLAGFAAGVIISIRKFSRKTERTAENILPYIWVGIPVTAVLILKPILYDGWRHMYFIYPPITLYTAMGLTEIYAKIKDKKIRTTYVVLIALSIAYTGYWMAYNHPIQNVYFNTLGHTFFDLQQSFDLDYWCVSHRKQIENLLEKTNPSKVTVFIPEAFFVLQANHFAMEGEKQDLFELTLDSSKADYLMTTFRFKKEGYNDLGEEIDSIKVDGITINALYDIKGKNINPLTVKETLYKNIE